MPLNIAYHPNIQVKKVSQNPDFFICNCQASQDESNGRSGMAKPCPYLVLCLPGKDMETLSGFQRSKKYLKMETCRGIFNHGKTCYFDAFAQSMHAVSGFREDILTHECDSADCKAHALRNLFEDLQKSETSPLHVDARLLRQLAYTMTEEGDTLQQLSFWNDSHLGALLLKHLGQKVHTEVSPP